MCFESGIHMGAVRGIHGGETLAETEGSREFFLVFFGFSLFFFLRSESPPSYFLIMKGINYSSPGELVEVVLYTRDVFIRAQNMNLIPNYASKVSQSIRKNEKKFVFIPQKKLVERPYFFDRKSKSQKTSKKS